MGKSKQNFLDYIPERNPEFEWFYEKDGQIIVKMLHKGVYNWIAQRLFHAPRASDIKLDAFGSFVWEQIDGKRTVFEIGAEVKTKFGEQAEPLYERLARFIHLLRENHFVTLRKEQ